MSAKEKPWAVQCFHCEEVGPRAETPEKAKELARTNEWMRDAYTLNEEFACPDCAELLYEPEPI